VDQVADRHDAAGSPAGAHAARATGRSPLFLPIEGLQPRLSDSAWWWRAGILIVIYILSGKFVNLTTSGAIVSSIGIAAGNTLEAIAGAVLIIGFANGRRAVERAQDLLVAALLLAVVATPVSATVGVTTLVLTGLAPWQDYASIWMTWWLGDSVGAWLVTPLLLSWGVDTDLRWTHTRIAEAALLLGSLLVVAEMLFGGLGSSAGTHLPLEFLCIPVLLWAAFRFGPRETTSAALLLSLIALRGTLHGIGPFARESPNEALVLLQTFMGVAAVTAAVVAALVTDQRRADENQRRFNRELESRVKERTEQLAGSEERLMEAQRVAHIGSWEWDVVTDQVWWSQELRRIYAIPLGGSVASYEAFLERVHPEDRLQAEQIIGQALADGRPFGFEHRIVLPDGRVRTIYGRGQVAVDSSGRVLRMTGTGQDITDWKQLEAERAELYREQAARREAEQANRLKDAFLATLSHELRTPLNAIVGWLQILATRDLDVTVRHAIEVLDRNATALRRLIEDMLDVSAILTGKLHIRHEAVDLVPLVEGVLDSLRPGAAAKELTLAYAGAHTTAIVDGDDHRLAQVVTNLVSNAIKFTGSGGRVFVDLHESGDSIVLRVSDTGIGISEESLPFIFDKFRQADASLTRAHGGLGLGLAIVREVVALHGGRVDAESSPPGATLTVTLPKALHPAAAGDAAPARDGNAPPAFSGLCVLVVDDDPDSRELLHAFFTAAGSRFLSAASAEEGLAQCEQICPDLLLVDLAMPVQDGYAFLACVRERGIKASAIAVSAYAGEAHRERALASGFDAYVPKPFSFDVLAHVVANLTERRLG
jgi:signal transduction histidine kinase/CheY-like chemotaxis protein